MNRVKFFLFLFLSAILFSCEKEEDEQVPLIDWEFPKEMQTFSATEEIFFKAEISDDRIIEEVEVGLFSKPDLLSVSSILRLNPKEKTVQIARNFLISDTLLKSGIYFFRILVKDGVNETVNFRDVKIEGIKKKKLGVLVSCESPGSTKLYHLDEEQNRSVLRTFSGSYFQSKVNSIDQQFWFTTNEQKQVCVYQLKARQKDFQTQVISNFKLPFSDVDLDNRTFFLAKKEGEIISFDELFSERLLYKSIKPARKVTKVSANEKHLLAEEVDLNGGNRSLQIIYRNSGALRAEVFSSRVAVDIFFVDSKRAIIFQNDSSGGVLAELNIEEGGLRRMKNIQDSILNVLQIDAKNYLLSTKNKILLYDFSRNTSLEFLPQGEAVLQYDVLENLIYLGSGNELFVYTFPLAKLKHQQTMPSVIRGIDIWYNR